MDSLHEAMRAAATSHEVGQLDFPRAVREGERRRTKARALSAGAVALSLITVGAGAGLLALTDRPSGDTLVGPVASALATPPADTEPTPPGPAADLFPTAKAAIQNWNTQNGRGAAFPVTLPEGYVFHGPPGYYWDPSTIEKPVMAVCTQAIGADPYACGAAKAHPETWRTLVTDDATVQVVVSVISSRGLATPEYDGALADWFSASFTTDLTRPDWVDQQPS